VILIKKRKKREGCWKKVTQIDIKNEIKKTLEKGVDKGINYL